MQIVWYQLRQSSLVALDPPVLHTGLFLRGGGYSISRFNKSLNIASTSGHYIRLHDIYDETMIREATDNIEIY